MRNVTCDVTKVSHFLLAGMRSDLTPAAGYDETELMRYCFRVAGAVGVLMCPILGLADRRFLPHAAALGIGMQLTNIARDVAEDWRRGRCYLPVEWTDGMRPGSFPPDAESVRRGVQRILAVADGFYDAGDSGIVALDRDARLAVRAASSIYRAIGTKIRQWGFQVLEKRARVSTLGKVGLFARAAVADIMPEKTPGKHASLTASATRALDIARRQLFDHGVFS